MSLATMGRAALGAACAAACLLGAPAQAGTDFSFVDVSGVEYDTAGVRVTGTLVYEATTDDDGHGMDVVELQLQDDEAVKDVRTFEAAVGTRAVLPFEMWFSGRVGTAFPGVGMGVIDLPDISRYALALRTLTVRHEADPCTSDCGPVPAVPEPSEYALMLVGLATVGIAARRRARPAGARAIGIARR